MKKDVLYEHDIESSCSLAFEFDVANLGSRLMTKKKNKRLENKYCLLSIEVQPHCG